MRTRGWIAAGVVVLGFAALAVGVHRTGHLSTQVAVFLGAGALVGAVIVGLVVSGVRK